MKERKKLMLNVTVSPALSIAMRLTPDYFMKVPMSDQFVPDETEGLESLANVELGITKFPRPYPREMRRDANKWFGGNERAALLETRKKRDSYDSIPISPLRILLRRKPREIPRSRDLNGIVERPYGFNDVHNGTNETLQLYGFDSERERNQLFLAYGKDNVRKGMEELFYIFDLQPNKEMVVAAIDRVAREGHANTGRIFYNGDDVVADSKQHYRQATSIQPIGTEISLDSRVYLVRKYILGEDAEQPEPIVVKVEPTANKTSTYITEFNRYSTADVRNFNSALAKDGLTLGNVMEEGIIVSDEEGHHVVFNEVLALLAERGLKPNEFPAIEKTHELNRIRSKNSGVEYVRLNPVEAGIGIQYGKADLRNLLQAEHKDNPFNNVFTPEGLLKILDREN